MMPALQQLSLVPPKVPLVPQPAISLAWLVEPLRMALAGEEWYSVTDGDGREIGRIQWPDRRPVLGHGGPTFLLQRDRPV